MSEQTDILSLLDEAALAYLRDMKRKKDAIRKEIALLEHQMTEVTPAPYVTPLLTRTYVQTDIKIEEEKKKLGLSAESLDRDTLLDHARKRFKISPKAGLDYLREMNFFEQRGTPQEIARFFFEVCVPCICRTFAQQHRHPTSARPPSATTWASTTRRTLTHCASLPVYTTLQRWTSMPLFASTCGASGCQVSHRRLIA